MFADLNNLMLCLLLFVNFVVADQDYLSSKFVENLKYNYDYHAYNQLHICNAGGKWMAIPYNSTHFEMKHFEDSSCKTYVNSEYLKGRYFDDIIPILQKAYAYVEQSDEKYIRIATYVTYAHRYCNKVDEEQMKYMDYADGFFYFSFKFVNVSEVYYPTCVSVNPDESIDLLRGFKDTWRPGTYSRTCLGGILAREEAECDDADPLALIVVFIIGLLLF